METPQEVQVWYILPSIRRYYAIYLKEEGMKQKDIAALLGITGAAVSQYLKKKRGTDVEFTEKILVKIKESAKKVQKGKKNIRSEMQKMLKIIKESPLMCVVCHDHTGTKEDCNICYI